MKRFSIAILSLIFSASAWAATPASGELTEASGPLTFTGGPYLLPTPAGITANARAVGCTIPTTCDMYALTVTIADKFRKDKKNEKEIVQIVMTPSYTVSQTDGTSDVDLYLQDSSGADIASSTGATAAEAISVPLKTLKDGKYTVLLITGLPLGASESVEIHIGRGKKSGAQGLSIEPMVAAPGETVSFDASSMNSATDYQFDFGDGVTAISHDGLAQHTYASDNQYLGKVSFSNAGKALGGASQPVVVDSTVTPAGDSITSVKEGSGLALGAFGLPVLFALLGLALLRRKV